MDLEGSDRIIIVGGNKDHRRARANQFENFEAVELGHLDVEENEIGLQFRDGFYRLEPVRAFSGDFNFWVHRDEFAQNLPCELFIVDDDGANFLVGRLLVIVRASRSAGIVIATQ